MLETVGILNLGFGIDYMSQFLEEGALLMLPCLPQRLILLHKTAHEVVFGDNVNHFSRLQVTRHHPRFAFTCWPRSFRLS
jgi:hypothetical protein